MRLLKSDSNGNFSLVKCSDDKPPPFAILSHTWGADSDEVSFEDMIHDSGREKSGYNKLLFCQRQAAVDKLDHFWIDTCCINKDSSQELSEAINSMFHWYQISAKCYVYLSDVSTSGIPTPSSARDLWERSFRASRWFTRGWTLQELLAPKFVEFYSKDGHFIGDKVYLDSMVEDITGIPVDAILGRALSQFTVEVRMSWAKRRKTGREEDGAYCLLGIFDVTMPLLYTEGRAKAFRRLEEEIEKTQARPHHFRRDRTLENGEGRDLPNKRPRQESMSSNHTEHPSRLHEFKKPTQISDEQADVILESLRFEQLDSRQMSIKRAFRNTCRWLLEKPEYVAWFDPGQFENHHGFLWIKGKAGCGKSTLMNFAVANATKNLPDWIVVSFFFHARGVDLEKTIDGMYRSLLLQLFEKIPRLRRHLDVVNSGWSQRLPSNQWTREFLESFLQDIIEDLGSEKVLIFIDALDECDENQIRAMISFFGQMGNITGSKTTKLLVCFSSRYYPHVTIAKSIDLELDGQEGHAQDITNYIQSELKIGKSKAAEDVRRELREKASGVFLWVVLVVDILNKEFDKGRLHALRRKLREIPQTLHELFQDLFTRDSHNREEMILCIQWVLFARRPLRPEQLYFAILSGTDASALREWEHGVEADLNVERYLLNCSKGLTEITKSQKKSSKTVQFIHESVRDFLLKENGLGVVWPELIRDFESRSHEKLKNCCHVYLDVDWKRTATLQPEYSSLLTRRDAIAQKNEEVRRAVSIAWPLLEYATENILYHADRAGVSIAQAKYLVEEFPKSSWLVLQILFQKFVTQRYPQDIDLFYVLADRDLPNLLRMIAPSRFPLEVTGGRYQTPFFAALARGNANAARTLLEMYCEQKGIDSVSPTVFDTEKWRGEFRSNTSISKNRSPWSYLADLCHPVIYLKLAEGSPDDLKDLGKMMMNEIAEGNQAILDAFLLATAKSSSKDMFFGSILTSAISSGKNQVVQLVLEKVVQIRPVESVHYVNAFTMAASNGSRKILEMFLDRGMDIDAIYDQSMSWYLTALQVASREGQDDIVKLLIEKGASLDPNMDRVDGFCHDSALMMAISNGHLQVSKILIERGADVNAQRIGDEETPLNLAAARGYEGLVKLLIDHGATRSINMSTRVHGPPVISALENDHISIVRLLLDSGADMNVCGPRLHDTVLTIASARGHEHIVTDLLNRGATDTVIGLPGQEYGSALIAASVHGHEQVVKLLLDGARSGVHRANIEKFQPAYGSPLYASSARGFMSIVRRLLDQGANINSRVESLDLQLLANPYLNRDYQLRLLETWDSLDNSPSDEFYSTPLQIACYMGQEEVVKLLLDRGADVNAHYGRYGDALHAAARKGHLAIMRVLLDKGAYINAIGPFGSALYAASVRTDADTETVELLLDRGADVNLQFADTLNQLYGNALEAASTRGNKAVAKLLYERRASLLSNIFSSNIPSKRKKGRTSQYVSEDSPSHIETFQAFESSSDSGAQDYTSIFTQNDGVR